jgi:hypothetical protein
MYCICMGLFGQIINTLLTKNSQRDDVTQETFVLFSFLNLQYQIYIIKDTVVVTVTWLRTKLSGV